MELEEEAYLSHKRYMNKDQGANLGQKTPNYMDVWETPKPRFGGHLGEISSYIGCGLAAIACGAYMYTAFTQKSEKPIVIEKQEQKVIEPKLDDLIVTRE